MILIGSAGRLWHVAEIGRDDPLPEKSMDVDPVTDCEAVAELANDALIGSEFERAHGWQVNLMPRMVLDQLPTGWRERSALAEYGHLTLIVPSAADLLAPKLRRGEPRDLREDAVGRAVGLRDDFVRARQAVLAMGEGAALFQERRAAQHDVGELRGLTHEDFLHDEEIERDRCCLRVQRLQHRLGVAFGDAE